MENRDPLISVIIPVYNVEHYIQNCLNSLINQTYTNWEAILIDDGSPDRSGEICEQYAADDKRFIVVHKKNGGQSTARNLALDLVKGKYITYLDSDDFLSNNALEFLYTAAKEKDADIVQCGFIRGNDNIFPQLKCSNQLLEYDKNSIFTKFAAKIIPCGKLYRREIIGNIRFPEGLVNEDDFTVWKYYYNAKRIIVIDTPLYYYTYNPNSTMARQQNRPNFKYFDAYRERIKFFKEKNEPDLEAVSRIQWMKSLVMTFSNDNLTEGQRTEVLKTFKDNYVSLKRLSFPIPAKLSVIFKAFNILPYLVSKAVVKMHNR